MDEWFFKWCDAETAHLESMIADEVRAGNYSNASHYKSKLGGIVRAKESYADEAWRRAASRGYGQSARGRSSRDGLK